MSDNSLFKDKARRQLAGKWIPAVIVCFISWLLTSAFTSSDGANATYHYAWQFGRFIRIPSTGNSDFRNVLRIIGFIISGPINFGVAAFFMKLVHGENAIIEDMFSGFRYFINTFVLNLLYTIFVILWTLLLVIPGIIAILKYSMSYYIMYDNPDMGAMDAINASKKMMDGHKMDLFLLWLSFIGWFILGLITLGIGLLWVIPYYTTAKVNFYESLKHSSNGFNEFTENRY